MLLKCQLYQISNRIDCGKKSIESENNSTLSKSIESTEIESFGGCHFIICGDFYQLPPPGGDALYSNICNNKHSNEGLKIFNSINEYSDLKINHRLNKLINDNNDINVHNKKIAFEIALENARLGIVTDDDIDLLNTRLCINEQECFETSNEKAIILSSHNVDVDNYNKKKINYIKEKYKNYNQNNNIINYICHAHHSTTNNQLITISQYHNCEKIKGPIHCPPGKIDLIIGGRYRITDNIASMIGLSNGTLGNI